MLFRCATADLTFREVAILTTSPSKDNHIKSAIPFAAFSGEAVGKRFRATLAGCSDVNPIRPHASEVGSNRIGSPYREEVTTIGALSGVSMPDDENAVAWVLLQGGCDCLKATMLLSQNLRASKGKKVVQSNQDASARLFTHCYWLRNKRSLSSSADRRDVLLRLRIVSAGCTLF